MIRWAILGTSFISDTMAKAIAASPGSEAVIVVGRDLKRLETFRSKHGIARALSSLEEAVSDDLVDAVYVGTPNHVHHEAVIVAAAAGKAVLSEKSLAVSMDQTIALLSAVEGKVFFVEGLMYLAHPLMEKFVSVLNDGRLGELKTIHASYAANIAHLVNPAGRGAIYNLGCYPASLVQLVVDTLSGSFDGSLDGSLDGLLNGLLDGSLEASVSRTSGRSFSSAFRDHTLTAQGTISSVDGNISESVAAIEFANGVLATVHTAETYGNASRFEVHGKSGTLTFLSNPWLPGRGENSFVWNGFDGGSETFVVSDPLEAFDHQVRMVERNLEARRLEAQRPSPRLSDSLELMRFLTAWEQRSFDKNLPQGA